MSSVEVAGLAGTWVAAGLAFLGLFAIVGPLLVWSASRSQRHKALMSIGLKNNGYLSRGLTVWPGIRFFQTEHVPILKRLQLFAADEWRDFDLSRLESIPESTVTWVQFGACLEAYGLNIRRGKEINAVETEDARLQLYLPVHKAYLFTFLVMGRYQRKFGQPDLTVPGASDMTAHVALPAKIQSSWNQYPQSQYTILHGLTGSFIFHKDLQSGITGKVSFVTNLGQCPSKLAAEKLSWSSITFLALGYLPLPSGHYLCFAATGNDCALGTDSAPHSLDSNSSSVVASGDVPRNLALDDYYNSRPTQFLHQIQANKKNLENLRLEVYNLQKVKIEETDLPLNLSGPNSAIWIRLLRKISPKEVMAIQGHLQELAAMTFVPPQEEYVRVFTHNTPESYGMPFMPSMGVGYQPMPTVPTQFQDNKAQNCVFITRASAQVFALGLLHLPWSQKNYIVGKVLGSSIVRSFLLQAASACIRFLLRLKKIHSVLHLGQADTAEFLAAADKVLQKHEDIDGLCELDEFLSRIQHRTAEVSLMIGVLVLTNIEYRELIYQSVRHANSNISRLPKADTELNFDTGHVKVSGAFGIEHVFVVDLDCLLEDLPGHQRSQSRTIKVDFATTLLAGLKAYMRSLMLQNCIDGLYIEKAMDFSGDVYDMI